MKEGGGRLYLLICRFKFSKSLYNQTHQIQVFYYQKYILCLDIQ